MIPAEAFLTSWRATTGDDPRRGALLALSGGPDSTALLDLCLAAGIPRDRLAAAHLDHGLRPGAADDAAFVRARAEAAGIPLEVRSVDLLRLTGGAGLEAAGRRERYRFLDEVARRRRLSLVATGHHADDQAETVFLRLLRGAGPAGLAGMPASRPVLEGSPVRLVRPLLAWRRRDLLDHLRDRGLPWREDPTNEDGSNLRSRVRRLLRDLPGELPARLVALAAASRDALSRWRRDAGRSAPFELAGRPACLAELVRAARPEGAPLPDRRALGDLAGLCRKAAGRADLGGGWRVEWRDGLRFIAPGTGAAPPSPAVRLTVPGEVRSGGWQLSASPVVRFSPPPDRLAEVIDAGRLPPPYRVNHARPGDRFRPFGAGRETGILRFLKSQGVPSSLRAEWPCVWSGARLVWVAALRLDEAARVGPGTASLVELRATPPRAGAPSPCPPPRSPSPSP